MDASADTYLDSTHLAHDGREGLPSLSRTPTAREGPLPSPDLTRGKSLRKRPTDLLDQQNATPPSPLKEPPRQPELRPRLSKMSLFNLFSKPKVEKLRGYAEQGMDASSLPHAMSSSPVSPPKQNLLVPTETADSEQGRVRPTTSRSYTARAAARLMKEPTAPAIANDRKPRLFDQLPLFQAYPQATKHGVFEVSTLAPEVLLQKSKSRTPTGLSTTSPQASLLDVPGNRDSVGSRVTVKATIRHARSNGSISSLYLPKKLFVLITSGYLLQYSETGSTERLPEKVLRFGENSAAYASDLVPGKHHVLQVAQAVDQHGAMVNDSQSLFSKLSLRSSATRRSTSSFLIIMADADQMAMWMTAIRKEIAMQGGKQVKSDPGASRPKTGQPPKTDLQKTPSQSHRYQVKRDPNGPSNVATPTKEAPEFQNQAEMASEEKQLVEPSVNVNEEAAFKSDAEATTTRPRASSDTPSMSSTALSVEQQQLEILRNSTRMSRTSTVATSVATAPSRTNSITSSPSDQLSKEAIEAARDGAPAKPPYRSMSSHTLAKRRSAAPLSIKDAPLPEAGAFLALQLPPRAGIEDAFHSPIVGYASPIPEPNSSPKNNRLSTMQSAPSLSTISEPDVKYESSLPLPLTTPPEGRPESFLAELPDPTTWANKSLSNHKSSSAGVPFPLLMEGSVTNFDQTGPPSGPPSSRTSPTSRPLRNSSNSFSLPLRVNPIEPVSPKSPIAARRRSTEKQEDGFMSPVPAVTTLEAKVNIAKRTTIDASFIPPRKSSSPGGSPPRDIQVKRPSSRLSLFPTATPIPSPAVAMSVANNARNRSPSVTAVPSFAQNQTQPKRLSRPASLQVRADHAPFLSSMRGTPSPDSQARSVAMAPIRSLKPSRSSRNLSAHPTAETFNFSTRKPDVTSAADPSRNEHTTPVLIESPFAPAVVGSVAYQSSRARKMLRVRPSLPDMDVAALGPPAPPPSAPLPEIPQGAAAMSLPLSLPSPPPQSTKLSPNHSRLSVIRTGTPIGVAIGEAWDKAVNDSSTQSMTTMTMTTTAKLRAGSAAISPRSTPPTSPPPPPPTPPTTITTTGLGIQVEG